MTDVTFTFNSETRSLKRTNRAYVGQAFDALSTTLHFEYDPIDFLSGNSDYATEGYVPYIMFRVYDDSGNPLIYSLGSSPRFDGYTFDIPWDVTSRVTTRTIEFQLYFVKNNIDFDGDLTELDSTEYIISAIASIAFQETIKCKPGCDPCAPSSPQTEPGLLGYINFFKDYSLISPVRIDYDEESDRLVQRFRTYTKRANCDVVLDVPYLDESGKISPQFIPMISEWVDEDGTLLATDDNLPTALLAHRSIDRKTDKDMAIPAWDSAETYHLYATVIGPDGHIYRSLVEANVGNDPTEDEVFSPVYWLRMVEHDVIVNDWDLGTSENVPSTAIVKEALDGKTDKDMPISFWEPDRTYRYGGTAVGSDGNIYRSIIEDNLGNDPTQDDVLDPMSWQRIMEYDAVRNDWDETGWGTVPSTELVKNSLDRKTDIDMAIPWWDSAEVYHAGSTVIRDYTVYISVGEPNEGHDPLEDDGSWWMPIRGSGSGDTNVPVIRTLGDGFQDEFTVRHGFGTRDVFVTLRYTDTGYEYTDAKYVAVSENHIRVYFTIPPEPQQFTVIIADAINSAGRYCREVVGDGITNEFEIEHNFGTRNFFTTIRSNLDNEIVDAGVTAIGFSKARITFSRVPDVDEFTVLMVPQFSDVDSNGYTYDQTEESDVWEFDNPLGRPVSIYTIDTEGYRIHGDEWQDLSGSGYGKIRISFSEPVAGTAILR